MPAPIVQWWKGDNSEQLLSWDAGIVDADSYSATLGVLIWNNRGGAVVVSDMENAFITTKNTDGTDTGSVATRTDAIVEVQVWDGAAYPVWAEVGGSVTTLPLNDANGVAGRISGAINTGMLADKPNFAQVNLRLHVLPTAPAGLIQWKTRVSYQYV